MTDTARDTTKLPADLLRDAVTGASQSAAPSEAKSDSLKAEVRPAGAPVRPAKSAAGLHPTLNPALLQKAMRWPVAAAAAGMVLAAGLGYGAAHLGSHADVDVATQHWREASASLQQAHGDVAHLAAELKSMRGAVEALKAERDRSRGDLTTKQAQLADKVEKANADSTAKIGKLADQLDRIEKNQRDPARFTPVVERLDRIEKQTLTVADKVVAPTPPPKPVAAATPAPAPVADPVQTGSITPKPPEPDPRKTQLNDYLLRDVDEGVALVESRNGRVFPVHAGQVVAGLGKIEAVERRGRQWVVVTAKGYIGERLP